MTATSADARGYIDLPAFALGEGELASLAALAAVWRAAVQEALQEETADAALQDFAEASAALVSELGDVAWQQKWLRAWHRLYGRGYSLPDMLEFFFRVTECCERQLYADAPAAGRVHLDLYSLLRRGIFAAVTCAVELGEEARLAEAGVPGELAALHFLREQALRAVPLALISLSLSHRQRFGDLAAGDLQSLPGLLVERLGQFLRPQDRLFAGRDSEWLLVLPDVSSMVLPTLVGAHIQRAFDEPFRLLSGRKLPMLPQIGAAMMPLHATDAESILQAARLARWELGGEQQPVAWFKPEMRRDWQVRFEMAEELGQALRAEKLCLYLQPQIDVPSGECISAELLLRWQRQNGEWVAPPLIIEMIEENGWRHTFTDWLIRNALQMASDLTALGIDIRLALNMTADDLLDPDLPELFAQCLANWKLPGSRFTIELTESAMMSDPGRCLEVMRQLRGLGLRLALDDFGTGYSSLSYLVNLPINEIKIDRSFICAMNSSEEHLRIVRTIIDLAWDLDMMPLAEGVETAEQVARLRQLGCNHVQGFLHAKPMAQDDFVAWFQAHRT